MSIDNFYVDCVRIRPSTSENERGRIIKSYSNTTDIKGFFGKQRDQHVEIAGKWTIITTYNFLCNDFNLQYGDIITYNDKTYEVVSDPKNTANMNHHIKATLKKIENIKQQ